MFQLEYKYGTEMANVLNFNKVNAYYFLSVGIEDKHNQTWFDDSYRFPYDIEKQIELGVLIKVKENEE